MSDKIKCSGCKHKLAKKICGSSQSPYYNQNIKPTDSCEYFVENPAKSHLMEGLFKGQAGNAAHDAIKEFETAIQLGLSLDDEMMARYFLGMEYLRLVLKNEQNVNSQESISAINQLEKSIAIDFQEGYGFFLEPDNRPVFQDWDYFYMLNSNAIYHREGIDAAIVYLEKKLHLFDNLPSNPMLHVLWALGRNFHEKGESKHAIEYYRKILESDVVKDNDDEAKVRNSATSNLQKLGYTEQNTQEIINDKINKLGSDINNLKKECSKKFSEAGKITYAKYKNNEPNFTDVSDIRTKWYAILAIDSEINKINQEIEALGSKEKKSGFFSKMSDLISKTAKQSKSKIDLYTLANKKDKNITEFGEQLYRDNGTLTLEELSSIWQKVDEFNKEIEIKEKEILTLKK